jgi:hypothetical protein
VGDDITNGELARRLDELRAIMQSLVGRPEYAADQRSVEHRFADLERTLAEERRARAGEIKTVNDRITDQAKQAAEHRQGWRTVVYTGIVPALVVLLGIFVQLWLARGGQK